jgi:DNA mismatch endonuclease (patch repair protein)
MSRIKGTDTKPETVLRRALWSMGLRFRLKSGVTGRPDIVFHRRRIAVFVDGCQWHCCPQHWVRPKSNVDFWDRKFERNRKRDTTVNDTLRAQGWTVLRFWEHEVETKCPVIAKKVFRAVKSAGSAPNQG